MMDTRTPKLLLIVAALSLTSATFLARTSPATSYELSIYAATPIPVWIGLLVTVASSAWVLFRSPNSRYRLAASGLICLIVILFTGLPVIRGYWYMGLFDSFHHLGSVRDILQRTVNRRLLIYPGIHLFAATLTTVGEIEPTKALLLLLPIFGLASTLGTCILTRRLDRSSGRFGLIFGALLLPITSVRMPIFQPIPTTLTLLYVPIALFGAVTLLQSERNHTPKAIILILLSAALTLYHPQHMVSFLSILIGISLVSRAIRRQKNLGQSQERDLLLPALIGGVIGYVHLADKPPFTGALIGILFSILGIGQDSGESVANRVSALEAVGGSIPELFVRAFSAHVIVLALAMITLLNTLWKYLDTRQPTIQQTAIFGMVIGLIPLGALAVLYLIIGGLGQILRYVAIGFILAAVFGAIGAEQIYQHLTDRFERQQIVTAATVVLVSCLIVASFITVFSSPILFKSGDHVTEAQMSGYEESFEYRSSDVTFASVRAPVTTHYAGQYGYRASRDGIGTDPMRELVDPFDIARNTGGGFQYSRVPYHFDGLYERLDHPIYLTVTESDRQTEGDLYRGYRYSHSDFDELEDSPSVSKVRSTGELDLFYITNESDEGH